MAAFECVVCGYVYDPRAGAPECGAAPGTSFKDLPSDFRCPVCGAAKEAFAALDGEPRTEGGPLELSTVIAQVTARTPSIKSFRLAAPGRAAFKPGQHLKLTLADQEGMSRRLSISSSPTEEGCLEVTKRITASRFSRMLDAAKAGDAVRISYPMGECTFEGECDRIALLSGGIGITPFRSICGFIADKRLDTSVVVIYSNRSADEIAFQSDFDALQRSRPNIRVVHTLSRAGLDWPGRRGRIDAALVREEIPDFARRRFFVCGPPQMVSDLEALLRNELGVSQQQIRTEKFEGYS